MNKALKKCAALLLALCMATAIPMTSYASEDQSAGEDAYFNDTVFVGDSISYKLKLYVESQRKDIPDFFGNAQFLAVGGLGSVGAQQSVTGSSFHPRYQGQKMKLEDSVAATGAKRMYIMFGMNDLVPAGVEGAAESLESLIDLILANSPSLDVVVQSVTPIVTGKEQVILNNENVRAYNDSLRELCSRRGFDFLDVNSQMTDDTGGLILSYCGDPQGLAMHLSDEACRVWIDYLRSNASDSYEVPILEDTADEDTADEETTLDSSEESSEDVLEEDDAFGQMEEESYTVLVPQNEEAQITQSTEQTNTSSSKSLYSDMPIDHFLKTYAMDSVGKPIVQKKWAPKLKNRVLNPPA